MATVTGRPENLSYLSPVGFKFLLNKLPNVEYFCQGITLPGISLMSVPLETPFTRIPYPGDRVEFQDFIVRFIIDEDMLNFTEIFKWMQGLGFPDSFDQYKALKDSDPAAPGANAGITSDATLIVLTGASTPKIRVSFKDCFPMMLSAVNFDTANEDIQYIQADATFSYRSFDIENIRK
jgi:hypothetical protein|tara:strand:- start:4575 stop:5111 length:537 start_codon:yes stop_codon:yes gene_type:complete